MERMRSLSLRAGWWPLVVLMAFGVSCKKDDPSPSGGSGGGGTPPVSTTPRVSFTIDGDGFASQAFVLTPVSGSGSALYSTGDEETSGTLMMNATNSFTVLFDGNTTTTQGSTNGTGTVGIGLNVNGAQYLQYSTSVNVTTYGAVGGTVEGTFSGTLIRMNGPTAGSYATISAGTFRFTRINDL